MIPSRSAPTASRFRHSRRPLAEMRFSRLGIASGLAIALSMSPAFGTNVGDTFKTTATDMSVSTNYTNTITPTAAGAYDIQLSGSYTAGTTFNIGVTTPAALVFGTLNDLDTTQSLVITNSASSAAAGSLSLTSASNSTSGAIPADLLYVASGANLTIQSGTGADTLALNFNAAVGNVDNLGTLNLNSPVSIATGAVLTFVGSGTTTIGGAIASTTGAITVSTAGGSVILNGANSNTGATTITAGTLQIGSTGTLNGTTGTSLTFKSGSGTFNDSEVSGTAQGMGALASGGASTANGGDDTIISNNTGSGNSSLTFSSLTANFGSTQASLDFVISGGTNGTSNKIVLGGVAAGFMGASYFFNGSDYAYMNSTGGYVRGINYGVDTGSQNDTTGIPFIGGDYVQVNTTNVTGQATVNINALQISDASTVSLGSSAVLTTGGILKSGGSASTISSGSITTGGSKKLYVRTDQSGDSLNIASNISSTSTGGLDKSGAGTLILSGTNTFTGPTYISNGTVQLGSSSALGATANGFAMSGTSTLDLNGKSAVVSTINGFNLDGANDVIDNTSSTLSTLTVNIVTNGYAGESGTIQSSGTGGLNISYESLTAGNGTYITITSANTYTGLTTVGTPNGNTTVLRNSNALSFGTGSLTLYGGASLNSAGFSNPMTWQVASGSTGTAITLGGVGIDSGNITLSPSGGVYPSIIGGGASLTGVISDGGTGSGFNLASGALLLAGANTYTGATTITGGTLTIGNGGTTGSIASTSVVDNATLSFNRSDAGQNFTPVISGTGSITQVGSGITTLSGANTFTGTTSINAGTLSVSSLNSVSGGTSTSSLGAPTTTANGTISIGATTNTGDLLYTGATATSDRVINLAGTTGGATITGSGSGALTLSSNFTATGAGAKTLTLNGITAGNTISGNIINNSGATSLIVSSTSTGGWTLSGTNSYTGTTTVTNGGTLTLDYGSSTAPATNIISTSSALTLTQGNLTLTGKASTTNSQAFASTTLNSGNSILSINNSATANPDSLNLGGITRNIGSTLVFNQPANGTTSATNGYVTTGTASTILASGGVAYATVGGDDWAAKDSSNGFVVGLSTISGGYTNNTATALSGNANMSGTDTALSTVTTTITSLRFDESGVTSRTVSGTGKTLITGGVLVGANVGSGNTNISVATLEGASGKDLTLIQNSTGILTVSSVITNNTSATGLTKAGTGQVALTGNNIYTGATTVNGGTLAITGTNAYTGATTINSGGTLSIGTGGSASSTGSVVVNTGGSLLYGTTANNVIKTTAPVALNGGSIGFSAKAGNTQTLGALTLSGASVINFGTGSGNGNTISFTGLSNLSATNTLAVYDWHGSGYASGGTDSGSDLTQDRLLFTTLTASNISNLADVVFYSGNGTGLLGTGVQVFYGSSGNEIAPGMAPVPEPSTIFAGVCLLGLLGWSKRRQLQVVIRTSCQSFSSRS